jgi:hypothetical protein
LNEIIPTTSFKPFINQIQQQIYDQNLQDQNSKIRECEKLSFLCNIYDENEWAAYHTFDFQVALSTPCP